MVVNLSHILFITGCPSRYTLPRAYLCHDSHTTTTREVSYLVIEPCKYQPSHFIEPSYFHGCVERVHLAGGQVLVWFTHARCDWSTSEPSTSSSWSFLDSTKCEGSSASTYVFTSMLLAICHQSQVADTSVPFPWHFYHSTLVAVSHHQFQVASLSFTVEFCVVRSTFTATICHWHSCSLLPTNKCWDNEWLLQLHFMHLAMVPVEWTWEWMDQFTIILMLLWGGLFTYDTVTCSPCRLIAIHCHCHMWHTLNMDRNMACDDMRLNDVWEEAWIDLPMVNKHWQCSSTSTTASQSIPVCLWRCEMEYW